jgi:DmsE family decaheme c-type cytochrome
MKYLLWLRYTFFGVMLVLGSTLITQAQGAGNGPATNSSYYGGAVRPSNTDEAPARGQAAVDLRQKQDAQCTRCHDESWNKPILAIYQTKHGTSADGRTPACTACHGESKAHLAGGSGDVRPNPDVVFGSKLSAQGHYEPSAAQDESCLNCHKSGMRIRWPGSQHQSNDVRCASCHTIHNPADKVLVKTQQTEVCFTCHKEQRAQIKQISTHPIDVGKVVCSDCHTPHGSPGPKLLVKNSVNETCFTCHADKRGPFLCQECHMGPHNSKTPAGGNVAGPNPATPATAAPNWSTQAMGRGCMNCHAMVHGSNSPAGAYLHR